mgnify:CR=1 FL=1
MVGSRRRSTRRNALLGSHQKSWIRGKNAVVEILRAARWRPVEVLLAHGADDSLIDEVIGLAEQISLPVEYDSADRLTQLSGARDHQGVIARMPPFPYAVAEDAIRDATDPALFLILDRLQDPFNLGAICRVACCFGVDAVFLGEQEQVGITSQVVRSSVGAINHLTISQVPDLAALIRQLKAAGTRIVATAPNADQTIETTDFSVPTAIVIGNEGQGVHADILAACDALTAIPQATAFDSLNAAVSAGILFYEIHRQRA